MDWLSALSFLHMKLCFICGDNPSGENSGIFATSLFKGGVGAARFNTC